MRINYLEVALLIVLSSVGGYAEDPNTDKINDLANAISHAEGFGKSHTIPSRYHNPGDLKAFSQSTSLAGQVRIGKAGHIVFKDDEAGKAALREYIVRMVDGRSSHYRPNMTFSQFAHIYAENWHPWIRVVSRELGVPPNTTLQAYFRGSDVSNDAPLTLSFRPLCAVDPKPQPPAVSIPESSSVLYAVAEAPVRRVPPLVEDEVPQHHKRQLFRPHAVSPGQDANPQVVRVSTAQDDRPFWK